jgi:hypothetical protein
MKSFKQNVRSYKKAGDTNEKDAAESSNEAARAESRPSSPSTSSSTAKPQEKTAPMLDQERHATPGCSFNIRMVSILMSSMTETDQDSTTASRLPRGVMQSAEGRKSLVHLRDACTSSGLELVISNLHGVGRGKRHHDCSTPLAGR